MRNLLLAATAAAFAMGFVAAAPGPSAAQTVKAVSDSAPKTAGEWMALGAKQALGEELVAAKASFTEALRLNPNLAMARYFRAVTLVDLGETDAAMADANALEGAVSSADLLYLKGAVYMAGERAREAIPYFEALTAIAPNDAQAFLSLGQARQDSQVEAEMPSALKAYDRALQLDPTLLKVYGLRGEILSARRDAKAVDENYRAWLAKAPDDPTAHVAYAEALVRVGQKERARAEIEASLALKPTAQAYLARARMLPDRQRDAVLADIERALALEPDSASAYELRGGRRADWDDFDLALADVEKALELWPDSYGARATRAYLHAEARRYDLAIKDYDVLIARNPNQADLLNDRCWTRALANKDLDLAMADCDASLKIERDPASLDSRAFVKFRQGDLSGSIADYDAALKLNSKQAPSLFARGVAKRRAGNIAGGDADMARARKMEAGLDERFAGYGVTP